jgi:hypothetical protein
VLRQVTDIGNQLKRVWQLGFAQPTRFETFVRKMRSKALPAHSLASILCDMQPASG